MDPILRQCGEILKTAVLQSEAGLSELQKAQKKLMRVPGAAIPKPGSFGISTKTAVDPVVSSQEDLLPSTGVNANKGVPTERMTPAKWKQTAKDVPVAIIGGGIGYGIGKTVAELAAEHMAQTGQRPAWLRHMPVALSALTAASSFATKRLQRALKNRRDSV